MNENDMIMIPNNQGYNSRNIQLTKPDTHIAIYTIDVTYAPNSTNVIQEAIPHIQFPIYVDKDYNLDNIIQENFDGGYLNYEQMVYYLMEETNENDKIISLLGMLYCTDCAKRLEIFLNGGVRDYERGTYEDRPIYYFDCAEWDYRVRATRAFGKDFVYPISENRKEIDEDANLE